MDLQHIIYTKEDGIATITLNRPQVLNAETPALSLEWEQAIDDARRDEQVKVLVVTGAGRAFCAGANPRELAAERKGAIASTGAESRVRRHQRTLGVARAVAQLDKPYIGAINGPAVGGGMDMASLCDIRIASENARFGTGYIRMGVPPVNGGCYLLPRIVGIARACELIWTGRLFDAEEALRIGYVNRVVPHDELMPTTMDLAMRLVRGPTVAIRLAKQMIYKCFDIDFYAAMEAHEWANAIARGTEDALEGPQAWAEKREPVFRGK